MNIAKITNKQNQIIPLLYKFRFLTVFQLQQMLNHKYPYRIKEWLKDLLNKKYITRLKFETDRTQPFIYCLTQRARYILEKSEACDYSILNRLYKEKNLSKNFITHFLVLADIYIFFFSQREKDKELNFFTKHELRNYDYFPKELPDVYIAVQGEKETQRYFLDLFDTDTPLWKVRKKIKKYVHYYEEDTWYENTKRSLFPTILLVLPDERIKKHIYYFCKAILEKTFHDAVIIFLTTSGKIVRKEQDIWEKVEIE